MSPRFNFGGLWSFREDRGQRMPAPAVSHRLGEPRGFAQAGFPAVGKRIEDMGRLFERSFRGP